MATRRTGSAARLAGVLAALLWAGAAGAQSPSLTMETEHEVVGTEDTFRVQIVASDVGGDARIHPPETPDFHILSRQGGVNRSISMGAGGTRMSTQRTLTLVLQALRPGVFELPPATLESGGEVFRTAPLTITVKAGSVVQPRRRPAPSRSQDPFAGLFPPGLLDELMDEQFMGRTRSRGEPTGKDFPGVRIPTREPDLFMRTFVDRTRVRVGEQVTMTIWIFSRSDLSNVDAFMLPKLEGFVTEQIDAPTSLAPQYRTIEGVPYRAYMLRRTAVFPVRSGELTIGQASADITTGYLYAGERLTRRTPALTIQVEPLPPGAPDGMAPLHVGAWELSVESNRTTVELNQPIEVEVKLSGRGNVRNQMPPRLAPKTDDFRVFDPTITDEVRTPQGVVQGERVAKYVLVPKRTGTLTIPELTYPHFNPDTGRYETARSAPFRVTVVPGAGGGTVAPDGGGLSAAPPSARNQVAQQTGIHPIRAQASFRSPAAPLPKRAWFWPLVVAPVGLLGALAGAGALHRRVREAQSGDGQKRQQRAAHKRLTRAQTLLRDAAPAAFYAEVEKAVLEFLTAKLATPVQGLTGEALQETLTSRGIDEAQRARVKRVLDACALGRYAPGQDAGERERVLEDASALMQGWRVG
ncbi:MAG TPA: BatD family protein [Myxococcaceae bacterium]|nr:BatD family protein [Myxococcaceae bacterium]